jgi:multicomponent K+:H+ antiporter subunit G
MSVFSETILAVLLVAGGVFTFIGSLALVRFKDFYTRLHGPTKATTLGVGCLLLASALFFSLHSEGFSLHEVLVSLFLFITAPISAHLLAKLALHQKLPSVIPLPKDQDLDPPPSQS